MSIADNAKRNNPGINFGGFGGGSHRASGHGWGGQHRRHGGNGLDLVFGLLGGLTGQDAGYRGGYGREYGGHRYGGYGRGYDYGYDQPTPFGLKGSALANYERNNPDPYTRRHGGGYGHYGHGGGRRYAMGAMIGGAFRGALEEGDFGGRNPFGDAFDDRYGYRDGYSQRRTRDDEGYGYPGSANGGAYGEARARRRVTHVFGGRGYEPVEDRRANRDAEAWLPEPEAVIERYRIPTTTPPSLAEGDRQKAEKALSAAKAAFAAPEDSKPEPTSLAKVQTALKEMKAFAALVPQMSPEQVKAFSGAFRDVNDALRAEMAKITDSKEKETLATAQKDFAAAMATAIKAADETSGKTAAEQGTIGGRLIKNELLRQVKFSDTTAQKTYADALNTEVMLARTGMVSGDMRDYASGNRSGIFSAMMEWSGKQGETPAPLDEKGNIILPAKVIAEQAGNRDAVRAGGELLARMSNKGEMAAEDVAALFDRGRRDPENIRDRLPSDYRDRYDEDVARRGGRGESEPEYGEGYTRRPRGPVSTEAARGTLANLAGYARDRIIDITGLEQRLAKLDLLDARDADGRADMRTAQALHTYAKETGLTHLTDIDAALKDEVRAMREYGVAGGEDRTGGIPPRRGGGPARDRS